MTTLHWSGSLYGLEQNALHLHKTRQRGPPAKNIILCTHIARNNGTICVAWSGCARNSLISWAPAALPRTTAALQASTWPRATAGWQVRATQSKLYKILHNGKIRQIPKIKKSKPIENTRKKEKFSLSDFMSMPADGSRVDSCIRFSSL